MRSRRHCSGTRRDRSRCVRISRAPAKCSTNWKLTRCSTASAFRTQRRSHLKPGSNRRLSYRFPILVVVKALSAKIVHKSDVGGVVLNLRDDGALLAAVAQIREATKVDRVLVQPMLSGLGEVLIGYRRDADVGPLVMLAAGGILAEIHRDREPPARAGRSRRSASHDRRSRGVEGARRAIAASPRAISTRWRRRWWRCRSSPSWKAPPSRRPRSNPLIVRPKGEGVVAVDALVKLA